MGPIVIQRVIAPMVLIMLFGLLSSVSATSYTFTKIAQQGGLLGSLPALNDAGIVVFDIPGSAIIAGNGGPLTTVASGLTQTTGAAVNNNGVVTFFASLPSGLSAIFTGSVTGTPAQMIATTGGSFPNNAFNRSFAFFGGPPSINNSGTVAFTGVVNFSNGNQTENVITKTLNGQLSSVFQSGSGPITTPDPPIINDNNVIAFSAAHLGSVIVVLPPGGPLMLITASQGPFQSFSSYPALNDADSLAFTAGLSTGGQGIFVKTGNTFNPIVDTTGAFASLSDPSINTLGDVAFWATLDSGGEGIYTGTDIIADKVIQTGDSLLGAAVRRVNFFRGLNNNGQIAFYAETSNGVQGIYRADPVIVQPPLPTPIPEPSTWLLLASGMIGLLSYRCGRWRGHASK